MSKILTYYQLSLKKDIKVYDKNFDMKLVFKIVKYKPYSNF